MGCTCSSSVARVRVQRRLIAELVAAEIARALGLLVPEIVFVQLDPELARTEPDPEIQDLIRASAGLNLALDYLPGSVMFDPVAERLDADLASKVVWLDAYVTNVDRTARNTNMLMWHRRLWLIDHGAALYFHHTWINYIERSRDAFPLIKDHVSASRYNSRISARDRFDDDRAAYTRHHQRCGKSYSGWVAGWCDSGWRSPVLRSV